VVKLNATVHQHEANLNQGSLDKHFVNTHTKSGLSSKDWLNIEGFTSICKIYKYSNYHIPPPTLNRQRPLLKSEISY
jgi:hypothetical protein